LQDEHKLELKQVKEQSKQEILELNEQLRLLQKELVQARNKQLVKEQKQQENLNQPLTKQYEKHINTLFMLYAYTLEFAIVPNQVIYGKGNLASNMKTYVSFLGDKKDIHIDQDFVSLAEHNKTSMVYLVSNSKTTLHNLVCNAIKMIKEIQPTMPQEQINKNNIISNENTETNDNQEEEEGSKGI